MVRASHAQPSRTAAARSSLIDGASRILPHESHGYRAHESILHVLAEMFDWAASHAGQRTAQAAQTVAAD